jgi:hypothetical protein
MKGNIKKKIEKKKTNPKTKGYWRIYDLRYKKYDLRTTYTLILSITNMLNRPSTEGRKVGRVSALPYNEYVVVLILKHIYKLSLRDLETLSNTLHNKHIDHSTYGKAFKRMDNEFLSNLLTFTYTIIDNLLTQPSNKLYMADSTGVSINRLYNECIHGGKRTKRLVHDKLHVLASYYPEQGYIPIISARWGGGYSSDSANLLEMVKQIDFLDNEYLLADGGYDCCELFEYLLQHNITPIVKTKEFKWKYHISKVRKTIKSMFNKDWYRLRGIVESIFGGLETKNRLKLDDRLADSRCKSTIATAIVHNVLTLMRVLVLTYDTE